MPTRVLVLGGDPRRRRFTATVLKLGGYEALETGRLADAGDLARAGIAAVVTDAELPDGDAIAHFARARRNGQAGGPPVLVVAYGTAKRDAAVAALGPNGYLAAPYVPRDLYAAIERALAGVART